MVAIQGYGSYLPLYRINRGTIAEQHGDHGGQGELAVPAHDEDVVSLGVHAAKNALNHADVDGEELDAVFTASTSDPFDERGIAPHVAYPVGAPASTRTADFQGSARAATTAVEAAADAIEAGQADRVLVLGSDILHATAGSAAEQRSGAGAAAIIVGSEGGAATLESVTNNTTGFIGRFAHAKTGDEEGNARFNRSRYIEAVTGAVERLGTSSIDHAALPAPAEGWGAKALDELDLDATLHGTFEDVGYAGAAGVLLDMVDVFEHVSPDETVLIASYGPGGSDALTFTAGNAETPSMTTQDYRESKEYVTYAKHREYRERARGQV